MPNIGAPEIIIVLVIALIVFGPSKLPELGKSVGKGMREFKASISGEDDADDKGVRTEITSVKNDAEPVKS